MVSTELTNTILNKNVLTRGWLLIEPAGHLADLNQHDAPVQGLAKVANSLSRSGSFQKQPVRNLKFGPHV